MTDLAIRCTCGQMQGSARDVGRRSQRLVCYCRDCQCFAWFLERPELLDVHGGSEVLQLNPTRVSFHAGHEHLACMRLSPKGVMRWYASCCNTPIGNTLDKPKPPFVGLLSSCWDPELDAAARDRLIGPRRAYINGPGHAAPDGSMAKVDKLPLKAIFGALRLILGSALRGQIHPSPFFEPSGAPRATPRVLAVAEREALRVKLDTAPAP